MNKIELIVICKKDVKNYKTDCGINFILESKIEKSDNLELVLIIDEEGIFAISKRREEKFIGWLNIPYCQKDTNFLIKKNCFKEKRLISYKIFTNKFQPFYFESNDFLKTKFVFLIILVEKEKENYYFCKVIISRKEESLKKYKNIIAIECLENEKNSILHKKLLIKIKINSKKICLNSFMNLNFIYQGIDFKQNIFIDKNFHKIQFSIHLISSNDIKNEIKTFILPSFKISERFHPNKNIFSCGIYSGDEMNLKIDNAILILPENCLKNNYTAISIQKYVEIKVEDRNIKISNLIKCFPDGQIFLKSLKLIMRSPTDEPKIYSYEGKLMKVNDGLWEQKINNFSDHGLVSEWNENQKLKTFFYYFDKMKNRNVLKMTFSYLDVSEKKVYFFFKLK